jgi:DNA (cytosine-5)-methyltransferase 1
MKLVDLFAGTGGFSMAFESINEENETLFANDILESSERIFTTNFPKSLFVRGDITEIKDEIPNCDILTGGFPCQPFSIAGKRLGFDDERSRPIFDLITTIKRLSPEFFILENVKNLLTHDKGRSFDLIKENFSDYHLNWNVLDAALYTGIPQHRERLYIIGTKENRDFDLSFDQIECLPMENFLEENIPDKYYYTPNSSIYSFVENTKPGIFYQYRRTYLRENKSGVCPTLTCNMGTGGHNTPIIRDNRGPRKLTPRECFNLQGFPATYQLPNLSDGKLYSLAGNAVNVKMVKIIMEKVLNSKILD